MNNGDIEEHNEIGLTEFHRGRTEIWFDENCPKSHSHDTGVHDFAHKGLMRQKAT